MHTRHAYFWQTVNTDIDSEQPSAWKRSEIGRLVRISEKAKMSGTEPDNSGERLKAEIAEQTRTIMREMLAEFKREEREEK